MLSVGTAHGSITSNCTEMTDAYSLSSGNVQTMKIKAEPSNTRSHQELSDQPFEGWKTRKSLHVEMIGMRTLLEGCVENTELHREE